MGLNAAKKNGISPICYGEMPFLSGSVPGSSAGYLIEMLFRGGCRIPLYPNSNNKRGESVVVEKTVRKIVRFFDNHYIYFGMGSQGCNIECA